MLRGKGELPLRAGGTGTRPRVIFVAQSQDFLFILWRIRSLVHTPMFMSAHFFVCVHMYVFVRKRYIFVHCHFLQQRCSTYACAYHTYASLKINPRIPVPVPVCAYAGPRHSYLVCVATMYASIYAQMYPLRKHIAQQRSWCVPKPAGTCA
jgi:hypothetical protein